MFKRAITLFVVLGFASMAYGDAVVEITALTPPDQGTAYSQGAVVDFQVAITTDAPVQARLLTLDFSGSDPALTFTGPDDYPLDAGGNPQGDGVEEFVFDFGSVTDSLYSRFPNYLLSNITYNGTFPIPGFMLEFAAGTPLVVGQGTVILPMMDGDYMVDALNPEAVDLNTGARIDFDFGNPTTWHSTFGPDQGMISGEPLMLTVVPEPATLLLLGLGGVAVLRRRR
jgi:hypothetical protein